MVLLLENYEYPIIRIIKSNREPYVRNSASLTPHRGVYRGLKCRLRIICIT